jgi:hypothetical protein
MHEFVADKSVNLICAVCRAGKHCGRVFNVIHGHVTVKTLGP